MFYFDTSALVKQYVNETKSEIIRALWDIEAGMAVSVVVYAETMATLHRKRREGSITALELHEAITAFQMDWPNLWHIDISPRLHPIIDSLLLKYPLRGFDAIHLASALSLDSGEAGDLTFACSDKRLLEAAASEGLNVFDASGN